ncbi:hypothetical protein HanHA300_Chr13g0495981 [Helianthus annuus]|nr:hypothetical protein HanHA300_Chr13g0495981 [Helianthus annuus]KAJ0498944.1 hypothetical protein HanHA89_Chr13g0528621 [Helianthus annuus]KAJ0664959.1 hypothetical protein HanLR1_Chr13g0498651 [Helianthus annuus]KAJ0672379.1 hypothetical protein HanOQP8_Chr13g0496621 [Helianthus annuus]
MKSYCSPLIFNHPPISSTPAHIISSPAYLIFSRAHSFPFLSTGMVYNFILP